MTMVMPSLVWVNAAQTPNPINGGMGVPSTLTLTSLRGNPTLKTVWLLFQAPLAPVNFSMTAGSSLRASAPSQPGPRSAMPNKPTQNFFMVLLLSYLFFLLVSGKYFKVVKIDHAVGLGPQSHLARARLVQPVGQLQDPVEIPLHFFTTDPQHQRVPLAGGHRQVAHPLKRGPLALDHAPEYQVVLQAVGPQGQVVTVGMQSKENARALVNTPTHALEPDADGSLVKILDALSHGVGEKSEALDA